jgi:hypothetical protein
VDSGFSYRGHDPRKDGYIVKKLFASLFIAGFLLSGVVGCSSSPTTEKKVETDPKKKAVEDAKKALADAEKALEAKKDDADLKKKVEDAKAALKKAEDAAKP